ncbi:6-phosphogluconate dehydrogenase, NADP(+)-dependent, decarboxylating [Rhodobacteraceae bacterium THAF1]|uniref:NADP-dependent phosphogluconate dehydrogenase n=1 Tax=Palleronia sp. THAF1 TaxID=2587842 RepID=UPI000F3E011E|nr:NADP-dependent phosphogluconate dehydrogenase [Palleronia sp. THAF1]QFU08982.1 6-phosphogluconate dehydrogenase, NADP(+)-dependent, decarboxylating [Palleronia sp. THAF1]VDC24279.1 6-phosphogluconate dehydrogenase, NADP(+)-dependent, decarboxylating [Rhodobacteraceae bacterium THAF1]
MSADIGLIGLGTMGAALALNIAEKGHNIAVFNRTTSKTHDFVGGAGDLAGRLTATETLEELVAAIAKPRTIILMVPAGDPVDEQIAALTPLLDADDMIVDAGNANFHDTNRRMRELDQPFLGIGVSGGEEGARHGPAIMGGGPRELWDRVEPVLHAIAAKHEGTPCADWMGEEGAGHFVKAVHNGIEYADMQLIAEAYGLMRDGLGMDADAIAQTFQRWNEGALRSYLIEISGEVAAAHDEATDGPLLDVILDAAGQKGTGRWTAIEAQHLGAPIPVIEAAVVARNMSARVEERARMEDLFGAAPQTIAASDLSLDALEQALICGKILCYDQGFRMIAAASDQYGWSLNGARIARVWRQGCIIRSEMLDDMASALGEVDSPALMAAPVFADHLKATQKALRNVISTAVRHGAPVPALSAALAYFDTMRTARGTANMIQGQRDFFGRHGFVRMDDGTKDQHGSWAD